MEWIIIALLITLLILSALNLLIVVFKTPESDLRQILPGKLRSNRKTKPKWNDENKEMKAEQEHLQTRRML